MLIYVLWRPWNLSWTASLRKQQPLLKHMELPCSRTQPRSFLYIYSIRRRNSMKEDRPLGAAAIQIIKNTNNQNCSLIPDRRPHWMPLHLASEYIFLGLHQKLYNVLAMFVTSVIRFFLCWTTFHNPCKIIVLGSLDLSELQGAAQWN